MRYDMLFCLSAVLLSLTGADLVVVCGHTLTNLPGFNPGLPLFSRARVCARACTCVHVRQ